MAISGGPDIVEAGLVLCLDAADRNSYPGSGASWNDLSGNSNDGTLINGPVYNTSGFFSFDGTNDYISGSINSLTVWSLSLWYLSTDISSRVVFYPFSCNTTSANGIGFGGTFTTETNNRWYFYDGAKVMSSPNTGIVVNTWYNLVVTKIATTYNLYTNGNLSLTDSGANLSCTSYTLGRRGDSFWYAKGNISQASIYNKALSSSEIRQNFEATKGRYGL